MPEVAPASPKEETSSKESEESSEEEQPTDEALCGKAWQWAQRLDTHFNAWQCKKITKGLPGWATRDTMICDLPEHGKVQPNHPDLGGALGVHARPPGIQGHPFRHLRSLSLLQPGEDG